MCLPSGNATPSFPKVAASVEATGNASQSGPSLQMNPTQTASRTLDRKTLFLHAQEPLIKSHIVPTPNALITVQNLQQKPDHATQTHLSESSEREPEVCGRESKRRTLLTHTKYDRPHLHKHGLCHLLLSRLICWPVLDSLLHLHTRGRGPCFRKGSTFLEALRSRQQFVKGRQKPHA